MPTIADLDVRVQRLGLVMEPDGDRTEQSGGILNPAAARAPGGELLLYPRCVAAGNISRVGTVADARRRRSASTSNRLGFALEPAMPYELRPRPGYGCEDPRVTYVRGDRSVRDEPTRRTVPRARASRSLISTDAHRWERLGLVRFPGGANAGEDKDAAFFPEPVISPKGRKCLAFYHRPMLHLSSVDGRAAIPMIERMPFEDRESIRIAYVPLASGTQRSQQALSGDRKPPSALPVRAMGVDKNRRGHAARPYETERRATSGCRSSTASTFMTAALANPSSAIVRASSSTTLERPDHILYRSPEPIMTPETPYERHGVVDNVVFPTGIDPRHDLGERTYDIYYGVGDYSIGAARLRSDLNQRRCPTRTLVATSMRPPARRFTQHQRNTTSCLLRKSRRPRCGASGLLQAPYARYGEVSAVIDGDRPR